MRVITESEALIVGAFDNGEYEVLGRQTEAAPSFCLNVDRRIPTEALLAIVADRMRNDGRTLFNMDGYHALASLEATDAALHHWQCIGKPDPLELQADPSARSPDTKQEEGR